MHNQVKLIACESIACEVTDGVLGKKVRDTARNISENDLCLTGGRRGFYKNYLRDRS